MVTQYYKNNKIEYDCNGRILLNGVVRIGKTIEELKKEIDKYGSKKFVNPLELTKDLKRTI